jgi:hypothetical protein
VRPDAARKLLHHQPRNGQAQAQPPEAMDVFAAGMPALGKRFENAFDFVRQQADPRVGDRDLDVSTALKEPRCHGDFSTCRREFDRVF